MSLMIRRAMSEWSWRRTSGSRPADPPLVCFGALGFALLLIGSHDACAQIAFGEQRLSVAITGATTSGKTPELKPLPGLSTTILPPPHLDPSGKPCVSVTAFSRKQTGNPNIYDQILLLENRCGAEIRLRACYRDTNDCTEMSVGGYKRVEKILGIFPSQFFRFTYREYVK
ncbi:hypothetical protein [Bradyrhizobium sp. USDA 4486]